MTVAPGAIRPTRPRPLRLTDLVREFGLVASTDVRGLTTTGLAVRTQDLCPGDVFAGLPGAASHGASFAGDALRRGAVAVFTDAEGAAHASDARLPILVDVSPRERLGALAARIYGTGVHPPLLFGVTGTNGKTTTVHLLEHLLGRLGVPAGVSSTAERGFADERVPSRLTTPEADELHALLARMRERGIRAAAIEVSAQALVASRVGGLVFDVAGFTNLTHEHLDDFGSMDSYLDAKARLFRNGTSRSAVVSLDSPAGERLAREAEAPVVTVASSPGIDADWLVRDVEVGHDGTGFTLLGPGGQRLSTRVDLLGAHQAANAALAIVMAVTAGHAFGSVARALGSEGLRVAVPGRLERVPGTADPAVYLDIAHTPDALAKSIGTLRLLTPGRLVVVFGADGDRDGSKRAPMGRVAADLADVVIVHDHHSRFEEPDSIRAMLMTGAAAGTALVHEVPDPSDAIRVAVSAAGPGGTVLWAGTGRTGYRDVAGTKRIYSFWAEARRAVVEAGGAVDEDLDLAG